MDITGYSEHTLLANGIAQHYYRSGGDKPPLILLHGFTDDALCWLPVADVLRADYDVIMPDARGHGKSARIADIGFSNEALAEDVAEFIRTLNLPQTPAVMGHSMGGFTGMILASAHTDLVRCLLLEDPPMTPPPTPEMEAARPDGMRQWANNTRRMQSESIEKLMADEHAKSPLWSDAELRPWAESKHMVDLDVFENRAPRPLWQSLMSKITCPVLLLYGEKTIVDDATAQEAASLWQTGQAVKIAHAGHCIHRDNFADSMQVVQDFLREYGG